MSMKCWRLPFVAAVAMPLACSDSAAKRPPPPQALKPDIVTGVINLPDKTELPAGSVARITLVQLSDSEIPGATIVEQEFPVFDSKEPPLFTLRFNPNAIDPTSRYVVKAKVLIDAKVRYENVDGVPVLTRGRPPHAVVPVQPTI